MADEGGGVSASQPPEAEEMKIGDIPINMSERSLPGTMGTDQNPKQCLPKASLIPSMVVRSSNLRDWMQFMSDHALIGKFISIQSSKKKTDMVDQLFLETEGEF